MCKKLIEILKNLAITNKKPIKKTTNAPEALKNEKARKQFYDDMETGVMDDDF